MSDDLKSKKALAVRKPKRVKLTPVATPPVEHVHRVVHHVHEALKSGKAVYDVVAPIIRSMRNK